MCARSLELSHRCPGPPYGNEHPSGAQRAGSDPTPEEETRVRVGVVTAQARCEAIPPFPVCRVFPELVSLMF